MFKVDLMKRRNSSEIIRCTTLRKSILIFAAINNIDLSIAIHRINAQTAKKKHLYY